MRKTGQIYRLSGGMVPDRICRAAAIAEKRKLGTGSPTADIQAQRQKK